MPYGLTNTDLKEMTSLFEKFPAIESVLLFGSRAMGNYKKASDIDLAIRGKTSPSLAGKIAGILEEKTKIPFFFDIVDYHSIERKEFLDHINQHGIQIYKKEQNL